MQFEDFQGQLLLLAEATNKALSDPLIMQWWRKYRLLDEALFVAAIDRACDDCTWWPSHKEFGATLEALMSPDERGIQDGIRFWRGWIAQGIVPRVGSVAEYAAIREALGLPPPSEVERYRCERRILERDPDAASAGAHGPVFARLLGADRPALIAGSR